MVLTVTYRLRRQSEIFLFIVASLTTYYASPFNIKGFAVMFSLTFYSTMGSGISNRVAIILLMGGAYILLPINMGISHIDE